MKVKPIFIRAITSLHVGSGNDLGIVDLPIQREIHTNFPKIEASSLKGAIRKAFESKIMRNSKNSDETEKSSDEAKSDNKNENNEYYKNMAELQIVFGFDLDEKDKKNEEIVKFFKKNKNEEQKIEKEFASAIGFTDAKILFFPVKSVKGVFAYVTCPMVLKRFQEDIKLISKMGNMENNNQDFNIDIPEFVGDDECFVLSGEKLVIENKGKKNVVLEEYTFKVEVLNEREVIEIPGLGIDKNRIVIVSDDNFKFFVKNSTEIITRIKINNQTGVVQDGGLFTEEYLPAESVLYSLVIAENPYFKSENLGLKEDESVMDFFSLNIPEIIQIGGNSTLGKGIVKLFFRKEEYKDERN